MKSTNARVILACTVVAMITSIISSALAIPATQGLSVTVSINKGIICTDSDVRFEVRAHILRFILNLKLTLFPTLFTLVLRVRLSLSRAENMGPVH